MKIATIHVLEGRHDERRIGHVSRAVQDTLIGVLKIPADSFLQVSNRILRFPSLIGMRCSDGLILLEAAFISGRPKETRLTLLKELNAQIVERAGISSRDLVIQLSEAQARTIPWVKESRSAHSSSLAPLGTETCQSHQHK